MLIHPTAIIDPAAHVAPTCKVGAYSVIGADVEVGDDTEIMQHVVIHGPTRIGKRNRIFPFAAVGIEPQDVTYKGEATRLEIGNDNLIRESATINRGTVKGGGVTRIGSHVYLMAYSHVGHDCQVGDHAMLINGATLAGHVIVEEWATVGAMSAVHQFCRVGAHAYIGGGTMATQDVMPFAKTSAARENRAYGLNTIGLQRRGFSEERIQKLQRAFRTLLASKLNTTQAIEKLKSEEMTEDVSMLVQFIETAERGVIK